MKCTSDSCQLVIKAILTKATCFVNIKHPINYTLLQTNNLLDDTHMIYSTSLITNMYPRHLYRKTVILSTCYHLLSQMNVEQLYLLLYNLIYTTLCVQICNIIKESWEAISCHTMTSSITSFTVVQINTSHVILIADLFL